MRVAVVRHGAHELGDDDSDAAHTLALGHGADVAGVSISSSILGPQRRLLLGAPWPEKDGLDCRPRLVVELLPDVPQVNLHAGTRQALACREGIAQEGLRRAIRHHGSVAALQPQPLRVRPVVVARLLLDIGDEAGAEAALIAAPDRIRGSDYGMLVPLAGQLEAQGRWTGATAVYRALLVAILERAYAPAYRHGARYWARLQALAHKGTGLMPLEPAEAFEARIWLQHGRKTSFWAQVRGAPSADAHADADADEREEPQDNAAS